MKNYLTYGLVLLCNHAFAQFNETIRTGRPGQSIGAFAVGSGIFQVQSGIDYFSSSGATISTKGYLSNTVIRYGLTEPFEISALIEYKTESFNAEPLTGLTALDLGMRYHIYTGKGLVPNVGFQVRWRLPKLGGDYEIKNIAPRFILATSQTFSEKILFITNWGAAWNGENASPNGTYTLNLSYAFTNKFGAFIESYGNISQSDWDTFLDGGFAYLVNDDLQLDISSGIGKNEGIQDFSISAGVSWRTKRK